MGVRTRLVCLGIGAVIGLAAATQMVAWRYGFHPALGFGIPIGDAVKVYPPWDFLIWTKTWGQRPEHQAVIRMGVSVLMFGLMLGLGLIQLFDAPSNHGNGDLALGKKKQRARGWGDRKALIKAGYTKDNGVVFGRLEKEGLLDRYPFIAPELLVTPDLRPMLVTGGTRSGKGRGIVVPTLLNWAWAALIFDPKAELWAASAGYRRSLGPTLFFNPRSPYTARFNPLAEITPGKGAVGQVKQLVEILIEPSGAAGHHDFWDKQGSDMLCALILHVLFTAPPEDKNLVTVRDLSADLDTIAAEMIATRHVVNPKASNDNGAQTHVCHPWIAQAAKAYASAHEKGRKSVQMTVRSYLNWIAGNEVEYAISASDFRIGDLMCNKEPVSLYVQVSPGDLKALQPLVRLFFHMTATAFTTHMETDGDGRPKENALLMALDEFPLLGKVSFFEDVVRLASGYGIKCLFIAQSLNDIGRIYGPHNGFLDNAHIYVAFAALDPVTRDKVSKLTGNVTETRMSSSLPHQFSGQGGSRTLAEVERPLMDASEIGALPDNQQLIFIAGHRPYLLPKLRYDKVGWMAQRAAMVVPNQREKMDTPEVPSHPWADVTTFGFDSDIEVTLSGENGGARRLRPGAMPPTKPKAPPVDEVIESTKSDAKTDDEAQLSPSPSFVQSTHEPDAQSQISAPTGGPIIDVTPRKIVEPVLAISSMDAVRQSWGATRAKRGGRQNNKDIQTAFDFDAPSVGPANDAPANEASVNGAAVTNDDDLLDHLHKGKV